MEHERRQYRLIGGNGHICMTSLAVSLSTSQFLSPTLSMAALMLPTAGDDAGDACGLSTRQACFSGGLAGRGRQAKMASSMPSRASYGNNVNRIDVIFLTSLESLMAAGPSPAEMLINRAKYWLFRRVIQLH